MTVHDEDIDALQAQLMKAREDEGWFITGDQAKDFSRALTALVAERDGYLEGNKQTLRALEEANEIARRYKRERDEARREICDRIATPRWNPYIPIATATRYAQERGWDCFAQQEGGGA